MEKPEQSQNTEQSTPSGFKVFEASKSPSQIVSPKQPTNGFKVFGQPSVTIPSARKPAVVHPLSQVSATTETKSGLAAGEIIASAMRGFGEWFARNRKVLIGAGSIAGLVVLILAIRFLFSLDFTSSKPSDAAASNADSSVVEVATKPSSRGISPATPAARPNPPVGAKPDMEPASGYGFVKVKSGTKLNLHEKPSKIAPVIKSIPNGSFVHILGYSKRLDRIDGENGRWCKISHVGTEGWAWEKSISKK